MQIRTQSDVQRHTVQCVLIINLFSEKVGSFLLNNYCGSPRQYNFELKIFVLLWLWYTFMGFVSFHGVMTMILRNIMPSQRLHFVTSRLQLADAQFSKELYEVELEEVILLL